MDFQESLLSLFQQHPQWAIVVSLVASCVVALAGLMPSVFVTAANIYFFGFINGTSLSIAGESLGAACSFILYRYWFRDKMQHSLERYPKAAALVNASDRKAAGLVFSLRLMPLVPSGLITFAAAIGRLPMLLFVLASTTGKIPALLLEAVLIKGFLLVAWPLQLALLLVAGLLTWWWLQKKQ